MPFVLQSWVEEVGCKMQSILLSGLRAPDAPTQATKKCVRWLRGRCQLDADPQKQSYMQNVSMSCELIDAAMDECEYLPVHYVHHLADAFAVVAYHHPDERVREHAYYLHQQVAVELFHFKPESREEFISRHQDRPWRDVAILEAQPRAIPISPEADHPQKSMRMVGEPLGCVCEMKDRDWNPDTGVCATCGNRFRDFA